MPSVASSLPENSRASTVALKRHTNAWLGFLLAIGASSALHCLTLTRSPPVWQDEVQIVEYGRTLLPGYDDSYGVNWNGDRPIQCLSPIGCGLMELAYRAAAPGNLGPRFASLVGGIFAAAAMRYWLRAANISPWPCTICATAFFWDPLLVSSYRGARVDAWSMGFMLMAFACLRVSSRISVPRISLQIAAGAFVAASGLTWASAILLLPLLLFEVYESRISGRATQASVSATQHRPWIYRLTVDLSIIAMSAAVAAIIVLLPWASDIAVLTSDLRVAVATTVAAEKGRFLANVFQAISCFMKSPFLPLAALTGITSRGPRAWFLPFLTAVLAVVVTRAYEHRLVYLVPYLIYGLAISLSRSKIAHTPSPAGGLMRLLQLSVVVWCFALLLLRTATTIHEWHRRDPSAAFAAIDQLPGSKGTKVLLRSWQLYYPVRSREWKYWGPFDIGEGNVPNSVSDYQYVIYDARSVNPDADSELLRLGYKSHDIEILETSDAERTTLLSRSTPGYGPYRVYARPTDMSPSNQ